MEKDKPFYSVNEIYNILKNEILTLKLKPSTQIKEVDLAKKFDVSRTPIRQVLQKLESKKLIKTKPKISTVISTLNINSIIKLMYVKESLEFNTILDLITDNSFKNLQQLEYNLNKQKLLIENKSIRVYDKIYLFYELDLLFHKLIFKNVNKEEYWNTLIEIFPNYNRYSLMCVEYHKSSDLLTRYNDHLQIINLIKTNEVIKLRNIYKEHMYRDLKFSKRILKDYPTWFN